MDIRERILRAATQVYAEAGYRGTTTRRIAQQAGVNEITLFRQFGTKESLVKEALQHAHRQINPVSLTAPADPPAELYDWAWTTYQHWYHARRLVCRVMGDLVEHPELAPGICEEPGCHHHMLSTYLYRLRELGLASGEFDAGAVAGMLLGSVFTHAMWRDYFATPELPPADVVVRHYVQLVLNAVGYRPVQAPQEEPA